MSNLFVSVQNAGLALRVFERGVSVVQNNVTNVNTPGYAKQRLLVESLRFEPDIGVSGGVGVVGILDSRSPAAEQGVRTQMEGYGAGEESVRQIERLEAVMTIQAGSGIGGALNRFFQAVSAVSVAPNDAGARQVVLDRASELARSFNGSAEGVAKAQRQADTDLQDRVDRLNSLASEIAALNKELKYDYRAQNDAGLGARMNGLLDEISSLTQATVLKAEDGSLSVYAGGQVPLVIGTRQFALGVDTSGSQAAVLNAAGEDVTGLMETGQIGAVLSFRNGLVPQTQNGLNTLAAAVADQVNAVLAGGVDQNGMTPGPALFSYDSALGEARTLSVAPIATADLALSLDAAAPGGNGNALQLAALGASKTVSGYTFAQFYGTLAARTGRALETARDSRDSSESLLSQAQQLREDLQKVNLDEEAVLLMEYQRAYEATAQLVRTIDEMLDTALSMIQ